MLVYDFLIDVYLNGDKYYNLLCEINNKFSKNENDKLFERVGRKAEGLRSADYDRLVANI